MEQAASRSILISGAGIAGPALAYWLLRFGLQPTILESAPRLRTAGYMIDFWGRGFDVAERMGLRSALTSAGYDVRELRIVDGANKRVGGFDASVFRQLTDGRFTSLLRGDLSAILHRAIAHRVEIRCGDSIRALEQDARGVTVEFERGATQRFDAVVGADGLHSKVRELTFGAEPSYEHYLGYVAAAFAVAGYRPRDPNVYVAYSAPSHQVARFAMRDDRTMFLFVVADDRSSVFGARDADAHKAYLRSEFAALDWECSAILDAMQAQDEIYCDRVSQIRMPHWSKGRIGLLGDAAFAPSLLAGQGAALAITGAYVLAAELARAANPEDAFGRYERQLRPFITRKQTSASGFGRAFAPKTQLGCKLRNWATRALSIGPIAKHTLGRTLHDDFALPTFAR